MSQEGKYARDGTRSGSCVRCNRGGDRYEIDPLTQLCIKCIYVETQAETRAIIDAEHAHSKKYRCIKCGRGMTMARRLWCSVCAPKEHLSEGSCDLGDLDPVKKQVAKLAREENKLLDKIKKCPSCTRSYARREFEVKLSDGALVEGKICHICWKLKKKKMLRQGYLNT